MEQIISEFIVNTCLMNTHPDQRDKHRLLYCLQEDPEFVRFISGSVSEFYIQPVVSCIGDVDFMLRFRSRLALPFRQTIAFESPFPFADVVDVFKMVDTGQPPGYVVLVKTGVLTKRPGTIDDYDYKLASDDFSRSVPVLTFSDQANRHGPAKTFTDRTDDDGEFSDTIRDRDQVPCIHCPVWPTQAADWKIRNRLSGWPNAATVEKVVAGGCDLVQVANPRAKGNVKLVTAHWRLSFSAAETVLLNSWTKVQQLVYHLLRFVLKREVMEHAGNYYDHDVTKATEETTTTITTAEAAADTVVQPRSKILATYYIKTMMLWTCEQQLADWWSSTNLLSICHHVIQSLAHCIRYDSCPNFFVTNCNLFDFGKYVKEPGKLAALAGRLEEFDVARLEDWFLTNYIIKFVQQQSEEGMADAAALLVNDRTNLDNLRQSMLICAELIETRYTPRALYERWLGVCRDVQMEVAKYTLCLDTDNRGISTSRGDNERQLDVTADVDTDIRKYTRSVNNMRVYMDELCRIDSRLLEFLTGVVYLHCASELKQVSCRLHVNDRDKLRRILDIVTTTTSFMADKSIDSVKSIPTLTVHSVLASGSDVEMIKESVDKARLILFHEPSQRTEDIASQAQFLIGLLGLSAVNHLSVYQQALYTTAFGNMFAISTTVYTSLYLHLSGQHIECLSLCEAGLVELQSRRLLPQMLVDISSPFLELFDEEFLSLLGLLLFCFHTHPTTAENGEQCGLISQYVAPLSVLCYLKIQCLLQLQETGSSCDNLVKSVEFCQQQLQCLATSQLFDRMLLTFIFRKSVIHMTSQGVYT